MKRIHDDGLVYYRFAQWTDLKHGIFTRLGGISQPPFDSLNLGGNVGDDPRAVRANHERVYAALGVRGDRACTVWQVHGTDVVAVTAPVRNRRWVSHADAMITDRTDLPLAMRFADCTPILLFDPVRGAVGMAHAGWRGTVRGVAAATVWAMSELYGCRPADIQAGIGPSIGPRKYQVGREVVEAAAAYFGETDGLVRVDPADGTYYLDLWAANARDLQRAGVEQVEIAGICTAENTDEWFSHRAEKGKTGRFGAVISL